jgi:predicted ATPase/class 3 adenylate cyclase
MEQVSQPSGTVTLVFTDIEGSTRLLAELGEAGYRQALTGHREVVREAFGRYSGYEVDTQGDSFFYAFASATGAARAAGEATAALEGGPIAVRIGVHTGEPGLDGGNYVGMDVHTAARVMAAGHGGQVVLSHSTRALLDETFPLSDLGEHRLKDLPEPRRLYQLGGGSFPPLKTLNNTNLPLPASSFVGRERELEDLASLLRNGGRLVTLTGPGGTGKTRLAIEAAAGAVGEYRDGVVWVGLAGLGEPALVVDTIARTLGARDDLVEQIGDRVMLLVLDNFEHVIAVAAELSMLLAACRNLRLLVTSRELLRLQGEVEYPVPPLARGEAEALFCARSRLPRDEEIADLCRHLDDLPLAVELAAARTAVLSPVQIRERLSRRLDLFKGGRDSDPRQQTLRATIEWSYELLNEPEKQLFARLAVFADGCTLDAAEEIADADLDDLQSLVDKSLVRRSGERFWMLETIGELARERLQALTDGDEIHRRHAAYFLALAERAEPGLISADQPAWLKRLESDHDNLRKTLDWFLDHGEPESALRLAGALFWFWYTRGHVSEARRWLGRVLAASADEPSQARAKALDAAGYLANEQGEIDEALALVRAGLACAREAGATSLAAIAAAHVCAVLGESEPEAAVAAGEEGVALARESGDDFALAIALNCLAGPLMSFGERERAVPLLEESLGLRRRIGDPSRTALALNNLAREALRTGELDRAASMFEEVVEIATAIGDRRHISLGRVGLGWVAALEGRWADADIQTRESLRLVRELGMKWRMAEDILCLAGIAAATGETARAARLAGAADHHCSAVPPIYIEEAIRLHRPSIESAKAGCDPGIWDPAWAEGWAMSLDDAAQYALS